MKEENGVNIELAANGRAAGFVRLRATNQEELGATGYNRLLGSCVGLGELKSRGIWR